MACVAVNGEEIAPARILAEMQYHPAATAKMAFRDAARALAVRTLLLQEARRRGLDAGGAAGLLPEEAAIERLFEALDDDAAAAAALLEELVRVAEIEGVELRSRHPFDLSTMAAAAAKRTRG